MKGEPVYDYNRSNYKRANRNTLQDSPEIKDKKKSHAMAGKIGWGGRDSNPHFVLLSRIVSSVGIRPNRKYLKELVPPDGLEPSCFTQTLYRFELRGDIILFLYQDFFQQTHLAVPE